MPAVDSPVQSKSRSRSGRSGAPLVCHARVSLGGLRVEEHRTTPPELVGTVIPWTCIHVDPIVERAFPFQENGDRLKCGERRVEFKLRSARERQTAVAASRAAIRRAWRLGTLETGISYLLPQASTKRVLVTALVLYSPLVLFGPAILMVGAALMWQSLPVLPPAHAQWVQWMCLAAAGLWIALAGCLIGSLRAILHLTSAERIVRMTRHGVTTIGASGQEVERPWSELRRVDPRAWPPRLGFADGTEATVPRGDHASWYITELACAEHLGNGAALRDIVQRRALELAPPVLFLFLMALPPAMSGPFGGGNGPPLPLAWPIAISIALAAMIVAAPMLARLMILLVWRLERIFLPSFRGRRLTRIRWAPSMGPGGPPL